MRAVVFIVLYFGAICVYAAPEAKGEETHNIAVKMVNVGLIQMDVNSICRAAGYVTPAELESLKPSGVVSDSTSPSLKELTEPITDKYDGTTRKISSKTDEYPEFGSGETDTEYTATSIEIETTIAEKDRSIATLAYVSTSSDKEATTTKFMTHTGEHNASTETVERGVTKENTSETEKEHTYIATFDHAYTDTRKEDATSTTEVPRSTKRVEEHEHDSTSSGRTTRDTKEATEKHTSITADDGLSETTETLIGGSSVTLSSDRSTSIATTRDERSPATAAHTGSTADIDDSSLTTKESEKSSVDLSTTVSDEHTHTSIAKKDITLASPAVERTSTEPSSTSSATVTEGERRTSPASGHTTDGLHIPPVDVDSTTVPEKSSTTESEKSSTTLKGGDKAASDDKSGTEEHTHTTVIKEHTTSSVHIKEVSIETITPEYHDHTTTSGEKLPRESSTTEAASSTQATTERNNGSSTDKIRSDRGKKVDYSVYGYLALSLLIAAVIIWISYVIYTRHQSNSYVLPATAAEATPLNHITTTT